MDKENHVWTCRQCIYCDGKRPRDRAYCILNGAMVAHPDEDVPACSTFKATVKRADDGK